MLITDRAPGFVGRRAELAGLAGRLCEVVAGRGATVFVRGEPGVGKSALVAEAVAGAEGCRVLWARADELVTRFPLRPLLAGLDTDERSEIAVPAAGTRDVVLAGDPVVPMVERLLAVAERLCGHSPVLWVLDDLQWADEASLLAWSRLARLTEQLPLALIGIARPVPRRVEVLRLQRTLRGLGAVSLTVRGLDATDVDRLLEGLAGARPGPRLRALARRAGGNPLYLTELVDTLRRDGGLIVAGGVAELRAGAAEPLLPPSLAAAIADRLTFLTPETTEILRMAAVLGSEFTLGELGEVTEAAPDRLREALREAFAATVLIGHRHRLSFRHPLLPQALYEAMPADVRAALHHQVGYRLAGTGASAVRVAEQLLAAPEPLNDWALDWITGHYPALARISPRSAARLLERAAAVVPAADSRRVRLDTGLATVSFLLSRRQRAERAARRVLARSPEPAAVGEMTWILVYNRIRADQFDAALEVIAAAPAEVPPLWRARLQAQRALILLQCLRHTEAAPAAAEALALGEAAGDRIAIGYALHSQSLMATFAGDVGGGVRAIDRALTALGDDPDAHDLAQLLLVNQMTFLGELDRWDEAHECMRRAVELADGTSTARLLTVYASAAQLLVESGRWDDALTAAAVVADQLPDVEQWSEIRFAVLGVRALIAAHREDDDVLAECLVEREGGGPNEWQTGIGLLRRAQAIADERAGCPERALARFVPYLDEQLLPAHRALRHRRLPTVVRLAGELGETALAERAVQACAADAEADPVARKLAAADRCRALFTRSPEAMLGAVAHYRSAGRPIELAEALEDAAFVLAVTTGPESARGPFAEAAEIYLGLSATWDLRRLDARLRPFGIRRGQRGPRRRPETGWAALTPAELKVAERVARGRSNPDIATELVMSRRTVQTHVSHILGKLGAKSRAEIARSAREHAATS